MARNGNAHILVVEDEQHLAIGIKYNLEAEGYRVSIARDGRSALSLVNEESRDIELIILDLMLPGMSGYDVCEMLRSSGHEIPVLMLSARTLTEDRTRGFDVGANQYLTKPFELDELLSRVKNLLSFGTRADRRSASPATSPSTFTLGDVTINFHTFEVIAGDQTTRLTHLEMKLLRYFIQNEGRVIPRQELLQNVWGMTGTLHTRAPDQFIRRLRKILEPDPARPRHLLTVRDAGYRFVVAGED